MLLAEVGIVGRCDEKGYICGMVRRLIRSVRQKLRMIDYYAAPRRGSSWSRALDVAILASLVACWPTVWLMQAVTVRSERVVDIQGQILRDGAGRIEVFMVESGSGGRSPDFTRFAPIGNLSLTQERVALGWPLTTKLITQPLTLEVKYFDEATTRRDVQLADDDPLRVAMERSLKFGENEWAIEAWKIRTARHDTRLGMWLGAGLLTWVAMCIAAWVVITVAGIGFRTVAGFRSARRRSLRRRNVCPDCGYDLRGLEFSERCPECGVLTE